MPINWKELSSYERLLAALVAASDMKVDFKMVAHYYGEGATYDSIEGRFRVAKKKAVELRDEAKDRPVPTGRGGKAGGSAPCTPRKRKSEEALIEGGTLKLDQVKSGRVTKTPTRARSSATTKGKPRSKAEIFEDDDEDEDTADAEIDYEALDVNDEDEI